MSILLYLILTLTWNDLPQLRRTFKHGFQLWDPWAFVFVEDPVDHFVYLGLVGVADGYQDVSALLYHVHVFACAEIAEEIKATLEGQLDELVLFSLRVHEDLDEFNYRVERYLEVVGDIPWKLGFLRTLWDLSPDFAVLHLKGKE